MNQQNNRGYQNGRTPSRPPQRKQKLRFNPNKEGMQALLIVVLAAILIIVLLVLTIKGIANAISGPDETTTESTTTAETTTAAPVIVKKWYDDYLKEAKPSSDVAVGELALVNFENKYDLTDSIASKLTSLYGTDGHGTTFVLNNSDMKIRRDILPYLRTMLEDLNAASPNLGTTKEEDRVLITSGYRSTSYQQDLYNKQVTDNYVAVPGHSEHHTGYAVDLKVFTSKSATVEFRDDEQAWMEANCADYGFIRRYDGAKFELTGILDETWHFRYVGIPHAKYITENGLCMEEYLQMLREDYNIETCEAPLTITVSGSGDDAAVDTYEVYYVPVSLDSTTDIPVPKASDVKDVSISGDNMSGFIVTVQK